jgi:tRNA-binding protein
MAPTYEDFLRIEVHVGTVLEAQPFPEARVPAYRLLIDFGPLGRRRSSAQITENYGPEELIGRQVAAVTNFPVKRIAGFTSEVLVLGAVTGAAGVVLLRPDADVPPGTRIL